MGFYTEFIHLFNYSIIQNYSELFRIYSFILSFIYSRSKLQTTLMCHILTHQQSRNFRLNLPTTSDSRNQTWKRTRSSGGRNTMLCILSSPLWPKSTCAFLPQESPQRLFSWSGRIVTPFRASLRPDTVQELVRTALYMTLLLQQLSIRLYCC